MAKRARRERGESREADETTAPTVAGRRTQPAGPALDSNQGRGGPPESTKIRERERTLTRKTRKRYASFQFGADGGAKWRVRKPERARDETCMRARPARRRPENEGGVTRRIKRV